LRLATWDLRAGFSTSCPLHCALAPPEVSLAVPPSPSTVTFFGSHLGRSLGGFRGPVTRSTAIGTAKLPKTQPRRPQPFRSIRPIHNFAEGDRCGLTSRMTMPYHVARSISSVLPRMHQPTHRGPWSKRGGPSVQHSPSPAMLGQFILKH
jgi:hypothetical protein